MRVEHVKSRLMEPDDVVCREVLQPLGDEFVALPAILAEAHKARVLGNEVGALLLERHGRFLGARHALRS
ncbi:hypothetical protein RZS08_14305, partial [Arthrospira platensis SPKY1]|nr:hypothetical protein [Arthrospira platensis SPKY1]